MKKILALVLIFVFAISLSACAKKMPGEDNSNVESNAQQSTDQTTSSVVPDSSESVVSTPVVNSSDAKISKDEAISIALKKVSKKKTEVHDLEAELEIENGVLVWEVEFEDSKFEYYFEINAKTGAIEKQLNGKD